MSEQLLKQILDQLHQLNEKVDRELRQLNEKVDRELHLLHDRFERVENNMATKEDVADLPLIKRAVLDTSDSMRFPNTSATVRLSVTTRLLSIKTN